jgi:hypothetical protein
MVNLVEKARLGRVAALEGKTRGIPLSPSNQSRQKVVFVSRRSNPVDVAGWQL